MAARKTFVSWLLGSVAVILTLLLVLLLLLPHLIDSDFLKDKLKSVVETQTGGQVHYQHAELSFLPRPSITLHQVKLDIAEQVQGTVGAIQLCPELLALLTGSVHLGTLTLQSPEVSLNVAGVQTSKEETSSAFTFSTLQESLTNSLKPLSKIAPDLALVVNKGSLTLNQGEQALGLANDLNLTLKLTASNPTSFQANFQGSVSEMTFQRDDQKVFIEDLKLNGVLQSDEKKLLLSIANLSLAKPALQIKGEISSKSASPAFEIDLRGTGINVDATRKTALALAGDIKPIKEIFGYLRGGTVPQVSFRTDGETISELGDLKRLRIKGQLEGGAVSIPEIKLDLTEVNGDMEIVDGVLEGTGVSTRLEGSTGHDGTVRVALAEGNDLFQMELMLSADLPQAQHILKRIVKESDFAQLVDKVTKLQGTATGKLTLGDSLSDINASVDMSDLNLSANYQGLPFPVSVSEGQLLFAKDRIELKGLNGTFGGSVFSGLTCHIDWEDVLHLDLSSGKFGIVLDETYPWVASFEGTKEPLKEIKKITGRLDLAALSIKGAVDTPKSLRFAASGTINDVGIETPRFPAKIELAHGDFKLDAEGMSLQNLKADILDANLTLSAILKGFPQKLDQIEISLDGKMGQNSVAWLRGAIDSPDSQKAPEIPETPEAYTLRTPITFSDTKILWQPDATTSFKGNVSLEKGPSLTLDFDYLSGQLQVKKLAAKDQYSDVEISFISGQDEINSTFAGTLDHKTLESLFIDQTFASGQLMGNFDVKVPLKEQFVPLAKGHLEGKDLVLPLSSSEKIAIEKIVLDADGPQAKVEATAVSWNDFTWNPVKATVDFDHGNVDVKIIEAKLCGIDSSGLLSITGQDLVLDFTLEGKGLDVTTSYSCLTEGRVKMTGTLDFSGKISSQGQAEELIRNMQGPLEMNFTDGSIEQSKLLARTLEVINLAEVFRGKLPDLESTGFGYSKISIQGVFEGEKLIIEKILMDGNTIDALGKGELDLGQETVDVELLVSPFKTVDWFIKHLPGVNYLLGGSLVAIPVSVTGNQADPKVNIMSPSSVGSSLLGLGERVLKSPVKLIETMTPGKDGGK